MFKANNSKTSKATMEGKQETKKEAPLAKSAAKAKGHQAPPVAKPKTQVATRLNQAIQEDPRKTGRSQNVVPLMNDFERMRKNLHELIESARKYQQSMMDVEANRAVLYQKTATLAGDTKFTQIIGSADKSGDIKATLATLQAGAFKASQNHAKAYQDMVLDYAVEWESVVRKMVDTEREQTHKLHKEVQHYEDKVDKLRKQANDKENHGKSPTSSQTEKLTRNEGKLSKAWEDYDAAATRTANLLEQATVWGWKDLHPLVQAMISFELQRDRDERVTWQQVASIQDQLVAIMTQHEEAAMAPSAMLPTAAASRARNESVDASEPTELHVDDDSSEAEAG